MRGVGRGRVEERTRRGERERGGEIRGERKRWRKGEEKSTGGGKR